jgi:hypothetical protein
MVNKVVLDWYKFSILLYLYEIKVKNMGYLDNSSVTVDAILTLKGRELLSKGW